MLDEHGLDRRVGGDLDDPNAVCDPSETTLQRRMERAAEELVVQALVQDGFPVNMIQRIGHEGSGFDIRAQRTVDIATGQTEVRRIEVKGYSAGRPVSVTRRGWRTAHREKSAYWLYVVWDPLGPDPQLDIIPNPTEALEGAGMRVDKKTGDVIFTAAVIRQHAKGAQP